MQNAQIKDFQGQDVIVKASRAAKRASSVLSLVLAGITVVTANGLISALMCASTDETTCEPAKYTAGHVGAITVFLIVIPVLLAIVSAYLLFRFERNRAVPKLLIYSIVADDVCTVLSVTTATMSLYAGVTIFSIVLAAVAVVQACVSLYEKDDDDTGAIHRKHKPIGYILLMLSLGVLSANVSYYGKELVISRALFIVQYGALQVEKCATFVSIVTVGRASFNELSSTCHIEYDLTNRSAPIFNLTNACSLVKAVNGSVATCGYRPALIRW